MLKAHNLLGLAGLSFVLITSAAVADNDVYGPYPVTVKGYTGKKTNSVSYSGQIARHALHDSLKKLASKGNGKPNAELKAKMMSYFKGKDKGRQIIAPKAKGSYVIRQTTIDEISKNKNIAVSYTHLALPTT